MVILPVVAMESFWKAKKATSIANLSIDFNEENMRHLMEYVEMTLGEIDLNGDIAQQLQSSGILF